MKFPTTRRGTTIENYHGTMVADPYRWLENADSPETQAWSEEQNALARAYLAALPGRESLKKRLRELWNYPRYGVPTKEGNRYFFSKNTGLQNQSVLYVQSTLEDEARIVLDPNALSNDGTLALTNQAFSNDGTLLAYALSASGSDWQEIRIRHVDTQTDYEETLKWTRFNAIAWRHDNQGFYYTRFPAADTIADTERTYNSKVYWHKLGTPQTEDQLIFERPDAKELNFWPSITRDGKYLLLEVWNGTDPNNRIYYRPVASNEPFVRMLDEADAHYHFIGNDGPIFYFHTNRNAPRGRIIAIDIQKPQPEHWQELVPQQEDTIASALIVNRQFVLIYLHNAHHRIALYSLEGLFLQSIPLPALGSILEVSGHPDEKELFFSFTSYLYPPSIYRYDFSDATPTLLYGTETRFDPKQYETRQIFYTSKDGTQVPMFLTHKKGIALDGNNPTLLYGYGGFNISLTPTFGTMPLLWIEQGGIYAVANLRGGNEYGEAWHQAGILERKQNVFDDFIAAAEWLITNNYTSTSKLAIYGRSNGGLLVGACLTQRPDLYGAVICGVPVIDMLRYHKFTVGRYWISDYGDAEHNPDHFKFLYAYSPLHNVKEGTVYPPTLIVTADTDDRVVPAHAKKFTAALQAAQCGDHPILLRLEMKAGHGIGKPITKVIEEESDMLAFLCDALGISLSSRV